MKLMKCKQCGSRVMVTVGGKCGECYTNSVLKNNPSFKGDKK